MKKKGVSRGVILLAFFIVLVVCGVIVGAVYIHFSRPAEVYQETLSGGNIALTYTDEENLFMIESAIPTSDMVGKVYDSAELFFDFTVKVDLEEANTIEYEVILVKDEELSTALDSNVKVYLEKEANGTYNPVAGPEIFSSNVEDDAIGNVAMSLYKGKKSSSGNDNYRLRMWISDTAVFSPEQVQNYAVKIALKGDAK